MTIHLLAPTYNEYWHKTWFKCFEFWKNSKYNIRVWDDKNINHLLFEDNKSLLKTLNKLPQIYKIDYAKYLILEKYGGAYFDLDVEVLIDFIPLISPNKIYIADQAHILISSLKNSKFWSQVKKACAHKITSNHNQLNNFYSDLYPGAIVKNTTGSKFLFKFIKTTKSLYPIEFLSKHHFGNSSNEIKFCHHHQTGQWGKEWEGEYKISLSNT